MDDIKGIGMKKVCYTCGYYTKKATDKTLKCYTKSCPARLRDELAGLGKLRGAGMGDGTTLGIGGVKT